MAIPRELVAQVRRLDEYDLRRLMILVRGLLVHADGPPDPAHGDDIRLGKVSYRQEHVRCGKERCNKCPHGPYWYAYWREDGKTRSRYIGRHLPGEAPDPVVPDMPHESKSKGTSGEGKPPSVRT